MKTTNHDLSRLISRAHEECDEPIRVSMRAFRAFEQQIQADLAALVAEFGNPRRRWRKERRAYQATSKPTNPPAHGT